MAAKTNDAAWLQLIEDHLASALDIADREGETLIAALISDAVGAVVDRYSELRPPNTD